MGGELEREPGPGDLPDPDSVVIPDDASLLDADLQQWRAERSLGPRPLPWTLPHRPTSWRVASRVVPMLLGALLLMAFLASLATTVRPAVVDTVPARDLASTSVPEGQVGGLLPRGIIDVDGATHTWQTVRPALLVILPAAGASQQTLDALYLQAQAYGIPLALVGPPARAQALEEAASEVGSGTSPVVLDSASALSDALRLPDLHDPVVVVVGTDGRIHAVVENPSAGIQLQTVLSRAAAGSDPVA